MAQQAPIHENTGLVIENKEESTERAVEPTTPEKQTVPDSTKPAHSEDAKEVKHEIKKILLTMLALLALVIVIYLINIKTDIILKFGVWATNLLNINV